MCFSISPWELGDVAGYGSSYIQTWSDLAVQRPAYRRERLERTWGGAQFMVRQFSACSGVCAFAHLAWQSSFTPQMALGEHSLQAYSFLEEPPLSSQ
jgi:hypothetical protein